MPSNQEMDMILNKKVASFPNVPEKASKEEIPIEMRHSRGDRILCHNARESGLSATTAQVNPHISSIPEQFMNDVENMNKEI